MKDPSLKPYKNVVLLHYASIGFLMPLFNLYLSNQLGFTNTQVGLVLSVSPIVALFSQPFWGMATDYTRKMKEVLLVVLSASCLLGLLFVFKKSFSMTFLHYAAFSFFFTSIIPQMDGIILWKLNQSDGVSYGQIRYLGSIGFALASLAMGFIVDLTHINAIFLFYGIAALVAILVLHRMDGQAEVVKGQLGNDLRNLFRVKEYHLLLLVQFLLIGTSFGSGNYLGLYLQERGQTIAIIGFVFFFMAFIEIPFMVKARAIIQSVGAPRVLLLCTVVSTAKLYVFSLDIPVFLLILSTAAQSVVVGLSFPTVVEYIRAIVAPTVLTTAISIYNAVSYSLANWLFILLAGKLSDRSGFQGMFKTFSYISLLGILAAAALLAFTRVRRAPGDA
ncbi:MFS transporter [Anaerotalea alkaliphila]|uniref:MFS transporter n=1 Tax=Anaerotalea alkaliphila TaxID=2662126 RepID=A0A7X5HX73_9FIRM|nr:MFS transporter [Anaerotalea alkaliphila]NDL68319.1 MFS transporter [Anaerotalea alkaliphila]